MPSLKTLDAGLSQRKYLRMEQPAKKPRSRAKPNKLRDWLEHRPRPMSKIDFAEQIGVSPAYVSQLISDLMPWPRREVTVAIGVVTKGAVTPNDLAGYPPSN